MKNAFFFYTAVMMICALPLHAAAPGADLAGKASPATVGAASEGVVANHDKAIEGTTPTVSTELKGVPENEIGPVFVINKIDFKNINPKISGFQIECAGYNDKAKDADRVLYGFATFDKYFDAAPSRRVSSEMTNIKISTVLYEYAKKAGLSISDSTKWWCGLWAFPYGKSKIPFDKDAGAQGPAALKASSVVLLEGTY